MADLADDDDMRQMAEDEILDIQSRLPHAEEELKVLLLPKDPNDEKNVILEIRAGRAVTRPRFSRQKYFECMHATPSGRAGRWILWTLPTPESAASRKLSR